MTIVNTICITLMLCSPANKVPSSCAVNDLYATFSKNKTVVVCKPTYKQKDELITVVKKRA